ncbi:MAG: hypothetical protein IJT11_00250 [Bacteroidaceae bacterium]|nr:hypothetical protein [Bacteroidaceae bacterium]
MKRTKLFSVALLAMAWLAGNSALAQLDAEKVYTIVNNNDANMFMQDNGTGSLDLGGENENSYWKFVATANADCYYIQNTVTGKYIQGYTAAEQEVATGDTGVEYCVKADATGSYAGKYRMSCTANTPHDFTAGTLGLNWKNNDTVQSFASVAEGNPRSAWTLTEVATSTPDPGTDPDPAHVHDYTNNGICTCDGDEKYQPAELVDGVYMLGNAGNVEWFSNFIEAGNTTAKACLTADIDFEGVENAHTPIGRNAERKFDGVFDGQFHRIKGMIINNTLENQGFFGWIRGNAVIKNLIIDKSCSITAGNRAAAIAGTLQTPADFQCKILNCVNEADVTSVGGVAAGFIGAGQSAYAYFEIHNCVNFGKITGASNNKAAAFNGWGNNSGNGNSQVWNCYNVGELSPLDGTNSFFRGSYRSVQNCYDAVYTGLQATFISAEDIASGKLCYLLNQGETNGVKFKQTIGVDPYPLPVEEGDLVYEVADYYCDGTPKGSVTYSNTDGGSKDDHVMGANYICVNCHNYAFDGIEDYMTPEADGFYHLKTVDDVEWFSHMVRDKGHGAMKVKLDNDIDFEGVENAHLPIGASAHKFFGHFDGQGYRIKGMVLTTASRLENRGFDGQGFFGSVRGGGTDANGTATNEVIIENLIIDASCSIQHDQNFAAGVVAHINSRNDDASNIIIRNCGNEAAVSTTGKNAAGILGCVETTNIGLKLYNLWNKGKITGNGGESAAICAWTGQRNVDGEVDVEGCWNIGEVAGVDGNGYNLVRRNSNIVLRNVVDLCTTNAGNQGKVSVLNTTDPIASGELCYLLNGDQSTIVYYQNLGTDEMPVYRDDTHSQVFQAGTINCLGEAVGGISYNNVSGETIVLGHEMNDETGICDVCLAYYQEPALVDGYYELKNAGNVEWFSHKVDEGGDANLQINGKLMNDIDMLGIENLHLPIGVNTGKKYNGTFDGQGFRIKNMIIERPEDSNIGFFGFLRGNAANTTVKNLIIDKSCTIHGYNRVGGITGSCQNNGALITLENIINEATVIAEHQDAAGIIGGQEGNGPKWLIKNVLNLGTVTAKNEAPYAGALCCYLGGNGESVIENFVNLGTINGHRGGNIGRIAGSYTNIIDLSDTDFDSSLETNYGLDSGLEKTDIENGKLAYTVGWGQFLGVDAYPTPLSGLAPVSYVGEAGYASLYDSTTGYVLNGDVKAHTAVFNAGWLILNEIENVPAGTPVILKGTYYNKLAQDLPAINVANDLKGTDADTEADGTMYVLAEVDDEIGFFKATTGTTIPAGKAYYQSTSGVKVFYLDDDTATGIRTIANGQQATEGAIYNVAGQRLQKAQKGINIIGGKKILF